MRILIISLYIISLTFHSCNNSEKTSINQIDEVLDEERPEEAIEDNIPAMLVIEGRDIWIRDEPSTGNVIMKLNTGDTCEVLEKGGSEAIRGMRDYWYKIRHKGKVGWVYGYQSSVRQGSSLLILAIITNDIDKVKELIKKGHGINANCGNGEEFSLPLHKAVAKGKLEIVKILLENGADVNMECSYFKEIIVSGIAKELKTEKNAIDLAIEYGREQILKLLLENSRLEPDPDSDALYYSIIDDKTEIAKILIEAGIGMEYFVEDGGALIVAIQNGYYNLVKLMLIKKAHHNLNGGKYPPIVVAAINNKFEILNLLLDYGVKVDVTTPWNYTALMAACNNGNRKIVDLLLKYNADVNQSDLPSDSWADGPSNSPLSYAAGSGDFEIVKILIEKDADVNSGNVIITKPVGGALKYPQILDFLLKNGADPNFVNSEYYLKFWNLYSFLNEASSKGYIEAVKLLLQYGADINFIAHIRTPNDRKSYDGSSLILAVSSGHNDIVEILLKKGADKNLKNSKGKTALDIAKENGNDDLINLLKNSN